MNHPLTMPDQLQSTSRIGGPWRIMVSKLATVRRILKERGWVEGGKFLYDWFAKTLFATERIEFVWLDPASAKVPEVKGLFNYRFLNESELQGYLQDESNGLDAEVNTRISTGKHFCYAALDGDKLAAYSWYALEEVLPQDCFGLGLKLPQHIAYMYKGFTHPDYRGNRLHGYLMVQGLLNLESQGIKNLVSSIDWLNTASIKSSERIGYLKLGQGTYWRFLGKEVRHYPAKLLAQGIKY